MERQTTDAFKDAIKEMLNEEATKDTLFAQSLSKENKNIDECCDYIVSQVKKSGRCGFADSEILGIAKHYYDEDNLENPGHRYCKVVVNQAIELTQEEKEEARKEAMRKLVEAEKKRMSERKPKPIKKDTETTQQSLFDL